MPPFYLYVYISISPSFPIDLNWINLQGTKESIKGLEVCKSKVPTTHNFYTKQLLVGKSDRLVSFQREKREEPDLQLICLIHPETEANSPVNSQHSSSSELKTELLSHV